MDDKELSLAGKIIILLLGFAGAGVIIWAFITGAVSISSIIIGFFVVVAIVVAICFVILWIIDNWQLIAFFLAIVIFIIIFAILV